MAKILVVDNNAPHRHFLATLLGDGGHEVLEAPDGLEALAMVPIEYPDLVISDIVMPAMGGYEFVRRLRLEEKIAQTPVIFCATHYREHEAKELAHKCGVTHVLTKPCEPEVVIKVVADCLSKSAYMPLPPVDEQFGREHLPLITGKLSGHAGKLIAANFRLQALLEICVQLAAEKDPIRLLDRFCIAARELIASRDCVVGVPSPDNSSFLHLAIAGIRNGPLSLSIAPDHALFSNVMWNRRSMRMQNLGGSQTSLKLPVELGNFDSLLVAPVFSPTRSYGWVALFHRIGAEEFSEEDERLAGILATLVGRVYESSSLYTAERRHTAGLEREAVGYRDAQETSAQFADIVNWSEDAILGMTLDGKIVSWNRGAEHMFGYSPQVACNKPISELFDPQRAWEMREVIQKMRTMGRYETVGIRQDGTSLEIAVTVSPVLNSARCLTGASAIIRDITTQKRLHHQLLVSQKMEAIGRLSAGVAHDFNNLLTVISGYSWLLLGARSEQDPEYADILEISKAAERAAALTQQLLALSRRKIIQPRVIDLNVIVADMDRMLRRVIGEDIELVTVLDATVAIIRLDPGHLEQIIVNLAVNARDAMPEGGKLFIQTESLELQDTLAVHNTEVVPGAYVRLSVTDTGTGMDRETQDLIFEPFFTTKEVGRGTGLGLSTVYGIVEQSGGAITVDSELGHGTSFRVLLPIAKEPIIKGPPPLPPVQQEQRTDTVLVVEDEEAVRTLICGILKREGYTILEAKNGGDALQLCEMETGKINLMISDITMPGITGIELASRFSESRPEMKVLLMSGYAERGAVQQRVLPVDVPFIEKPFVPQTFARKVREVLEHAAIHTEQLG